MTSSSMPTVEEADPPVVTSVGNDSYSTEQVYDAKMSKRKGLLSTILSKSSSSSSSTMGANSSTLG